ncbi:MAG: MarR family transcriptional regulator [Bradyrhizobiaceae bacterium]|nr:MAG: MarR family transcriptional regulator [Bradyrhizobiaceae bacterium]
MDQDGQVREVCNCSSLRRATRHVSLMYDRHLAASGLTSGQYSILSEIRRRGKTAPALGELAQAIVMDRTALTHTLKPLERDGLVELKQDPDDGRTRRVHITAKGIRRHEAAAVQWRKAQQTFTAAVGADEAASLRALLRLVTQTELGNRP